MALNMIELQDERQTNKNGLQLIYEVRTGPNPTPPLVIRRDRPAVSSNLSVALPTNLSANNNDNPP